MRTRTRMILSFAVAIAAVLLAAPQGLVPWGEQLHALFRSHHWLALPAVVSVLLIAAGVLLPREPLGVPPRPQLIALGVGVLMLVEPLTHLALLALIAWHAPAGSGDLILPRVGGGNRTVFLQVTVLALVVPAAEEFFFRGRLLPFLVHRLGRRSAWSLSTLAFAAAHGDPAQALVALPLGMLLGWLRLSGSGVGVCILVHQAHNILFLAGGPTLIGQPWVGLILAIAGVVCIGMAWRWPGSARGSFELAATSCLAALAVISATYPLYQRVQERVWLTAMHRAVTLGRLSNHHLLARIDDQCASGRLDMRRRALLAQALIERPCRRGDGDRQVWVLGRIAPDRVSARDEESAHEALKSLALCPQTFPAHHQAARTLGAAYPLAFAQVAAWAPEQIIRDWLPLPAGSAQAQDQILASSGFARSMLLAQLERAYPGRVADLVLSLPPERVVDADRIFLRQRYPDFESRLHELDKREPARARAFTSP
ncbi:MAG: CPBP family intramembrane metalloprotease [Planctomycetes bacterium]|nr:CPBP family intramembrane metalloprotease [Planctomycetota bacterium]